MSTRLAILLALLWCGCDSQLLTGESTLRTPLSVEIQVCVNSQLILSVEVEDQKNSIQTYMTRVLQTTAVYHIRTYLNTKTGGNCFLFVYQSPTLDLARQSIALLNSITEISGDNQIPFFVDVKAVQWVGIQDNLFGLGWSINPSDLILWGNATAGLLLLCILGLCVLVLVFNKKERIYAEKLLEEDRKLLKVVKK